MLNTSHFFIAKIPNKRELQQIAINHSSGIKSKDFTNIYRKYATEPYSFLVNDTTPASNYPLTLFRMGFFGAAHGLGGGLAFWPPLPKICHTYPTVMKLGTVTPYRRKIQKMYKSRDMFLEFC